uniref:Fructose-bisphosphate aldolase n=1 Tax=Eufriesea mexicana TaxID=516756 RepID=A0A310S4M1_9HYME
MGGFNTVASMTIALLNDSNVTISVALHSVHGQSVDSRKKASVEAEAYTIGGKEHGVIGSREITSEKDCQAVAATRNDFLAAGISNINEKYPKNRDGVKFGVLKNLSLASNKPMVLHGVSGIPREETKKMINLGINNFNVNTELQGVFAIAIEEYVTEGKDSEDKGFDPRKIVKPGVEAIKLKVKEM